jgi:DNA-binding Lrp family transcriptional regulator
MKFDEIDGKILRLLLGNSRLKKTKIAKECGLSSTAIINRIDLMKTRGLIIKPALNLNFASFGYFHPVVIGVNLRPNIEQHIIGLINAHTVVAAIDRTIGRYDLCLFVFAKNLKDLDRLKNLVISQEGVNKIEVHIWHEFQLNYTNINLTSTRECELNGQT